MVNNQNRTGSSREYIIHPGETIKEVLKDRNMSLNDLSISTGVGEGDIRSVINGQKNISPSFASKLYYTLGIETEFWLNLQLNNDRELLLFCHKSS
ncbi:MAG: HigA family addiction module antitoxin [Erysipelotrichaceae bacterium]